MKVTVMAGLSAKGDMKINSCHKKTMMRSKPAMFVFPKRFSKD
jgi:hypothetical protein